MHGRAAGFRAPGTGNEAVITSYSIHYTKLYDNLMAVAHYLDALEWQRDVARLHAIFGGKNPHPNFLVGGVACPIDLNSDSAINSYNFV